MCRKNNTIIYCFIYYLYYYIIFIIYYSSDSPSSLITESLSVTQLLLHTRRLSRITAKALVTSNIIQSVCLVGKGRLNKNKTSNTFSMLQQTALRHYLHRSSMPSSLEILSLRNAVTSHCRYVRSYALK